MSDGSVGTGVWVADPVGSGHGKCPVLVGQTLGSPQFCRGDPEGGPVLSGRPNIDQISTTILLHKMCRASHPHNHHLHHHPHHCPLLPPQPPANPASASVGNLKLFPTKSSCPHMKLDESPRCRVVQLLLMLRRASLLLRASLGLASPE